MSVVFLDGRNLPVFSGTPFVALDTDALEEGWRPGRFLQNWLEGPGLAGAAVLPEVLDESLASIYERALEEPEFGEERLAHHAAVVGELGHVIVPTPHLLAVRERFLATEPVARLIAEKPHWRVRALVAATAIEYGMPIFGGSGFYRRLAETHSLPGVCNPRSGKWTVLPS